MKYFIKLAVGSLLCAFTIISLFGYAFFDYVWWTPLEKGFDARGLAIIYMLLGSLWAGIFLLLTSKN